MWRHVLPAALAVGTLMISHAPAFADFLPVSADRGQSTSVLLFTHSALHPESSSAQTTEFGPFINSLFDADTIGNRVNATASAGQESDIHPGGDDVIEGTGTASIGLFNPDARGIIQAQSYFDFYFTVGTQTEATLNWSLDSSDSASSANLLLEEVSGAVLVFQSALNGLANGTASLTLATGTIYHLWAEAGATRFGPAGPDGLISASWDFSLSETGAAAAVGVTAFQNPEPGTLVLGLMGGGSLAALYLRRRRQAS